MTGSYQQDGRLNMLMNKCMDEVLTINIYNVRPPEGDLTTGWREEPMTAGLPLAQVRLHIDSLAIDHLPMAVNNDKRGLEHLFAYVFAKALDNAEKISMIHQNEIKISAKHIGRLVKESTSGRYQKKHFFQQIRKSALGFSALCGALISLY